MTQELWKVVSFFREWVPIKNKTDKDFKYIIDTDFLLNKKEMFKFKWEQENFTFKIDYD